LSGKKTVVKFSHGDYDSRIAILPNTKTVGQLRKDEWEEAFKEAAARIVAEERARQ